MHTFSLLFATAAFIGSVKAHGYVKQVTLQGQQYTGYLPWTDPYTSPQPQRIVRKVPGDGPILSQTSPDLPCNIGGNDPAGMTAEANAGDEISFTWSTWYPEHRGPFVVHMADCGGSCSNFKSSDAKWFTTDQRVFLSDGVTWYTDTFLANSNTFTTRIPSNLKPGEYLIRNQLVALHSTGAPQFYMSCSQLRVSGIGNGYPVESDYSTASELVQGYEKMNIWGSPTPSIASIPVAGKGLASFIDGFANSQIDPPTGTQSTSPATTQVPPQTHTHTTCKVRRKRTMEKRQQQPPASLARRGVAEAHRLFKSRRHTEFHY